MKYLLLLLLCNSCVHVQFPRKVPQPEFCKPELDTLKQLVWNEPDNFDYEHLIIEGPDYICSQKAIQYYPLIQKTCKKLERCR